MYFPGILAGKPVAVTSNRGPGRVSLRPGADPQLEQQYYQRKRTLAQSGEVVVPYPFHTDEHRFVQAFIVE